MCEERRSAQRGSADPVLRPTAVSLEALVFSHRPTREASVQIAQRRVKCRLIVTAIIRNPAPNDGVEHTRQVVDPPVNATTKLPVANFLSDRLGRSVTDAGTEVDEELSPPIFRSSGSERVAQIIELSVGISSAPVIILTIDDFRLGRMKLQPARRKALLKRLLQGHRLFLAATVAEDVIGEPLERYCWMMYYHPPVERVVEKEIAQQGRNNRPLRGPFLPGFQCAVFELDRGLKPPLSVQQHPWTVGVLSYRSQ